MKLENKYLKYLKYVFIHKYYVLIYGLKFKVPIINLILHDWDKFLPSMIISYANYFYGKKLDETGYIHKPGENDIFDINWLQHIHYNKHHWQHWILQNDEDDLKILKMSDVDCREMLADWQAAAIAQGKPDIKSWYLKNYHKIKLHPKTRRYVDLFFSIVRTQKIPKHGTNHKYGN